MVNTVLTIFQVVCSLVM